MSGDGPPRLFIDFRLYIQISINLNPEPARTYSSTALTGKIYSFIENFKSHAIIITGFINNRDSNLTKYEVHYYKRSIIKIVPAPRT